MTPYCCRLLGTDFTIYALVTDMLIAILGCCSKEELEEEDEDEYIEAESSAVDDKDDRRRVIRNKILAVGRMSRVFSLLRFVYFASHRAQGTLVFLLSVRNRNGCPNSRTCLAQTDFLLVHWRLGLKASRRPFPTSKTRNYYPYSHPCFH